MNGDIRALYRALERRARSTELTSEMMVQIAEMTLITPHRFGQVIAVDKKSELRTAFRILAATLAGDEKPNLAAFAEAAYDAVKQAVRRGRHPGAALGRKRVVDEGLVRSTSNMARAALYAEYSRAQDADDLVRRAVTRVQKERQKFRRGTRRLPIASNDPLRSLFSLPKQGSVRVLPGDLRERLVDPRNPISSVLRDVSIFSEERLREALGEDLWRQCRPIGFADARRARVLIEVPSSSVANTLQMRSKEILNRLQKLVGFESANELRFRVVSRRPQSH